MVGAFLITVTQLEKTGSIGKVFIPLEQIPLSKLEIVRAFGKAIYVQQMNYNRKQKVHVRLSAFIFMYECRSVDIRAF